MKLCFSSTPIAPTRSLPLTVAGCLMVLQISSMLHYPAWMCKGHRPATPPYWHSTLIYLIRRRSNLPDYLLPDFLFHFHEIKDTQSCTVIAGYFPERKLLRISRFCGYLRKFSLRNLGAQVSNPQKISPQKSYFPPISHKSFLLYGILGERICD